MNLNNMTMRARLGLSFGLMVLLIVVLSTVAIKDMGNAKAQFHDFVTGIDARAHLAQEVRSAVDRRAVAARNLVLATQPADRNIEKQAVASAHDDVQKRLAQLKQAVDAPAFPPTSRPSSAIWRRSSSRMAPSHLPSSIWRCRTGRTRPSPRSMPNVVRSWPP